MPKARTAVGQNGRGTLWNDEGTDSCAGQNGQHAPNPGAHLYRDHREHTPGDNDSKWYQIIYDFPRARLVEVQGYQKFPGGILPIMGQVMLPKS